MGVGHLTDRAERAEGLQVQRAARHHPAGQGADRRVRPDHAVELAGQPDRLQGGAGAGRGLHHGAQAQRARARSRRRSGRRSCTPPACRPACSTWSTATARRWARRQQPPRCRHGVFTGSTRAGIEVARNAAPTVKRVHQELGGKSPNIVLPDADLKPLSHGRRARRDEQQRARAAMRPRVCWCPTAKWPKPGRRQGESRRSHHRGRARQRRRAGPGGVGQVQWNKIQALIAKGIDEGATVVAGGPGKPEGLEQRLLRQAHGAGPGQ
jgi:hypothetical protein